MVKKLIKAQVVLLAIGTIFAYYTVYEDFSRFYGYEGTLFKIKDCVVPNPVVTPCFYGAFGFLLALILAIRILKHTDIKTQFKKQRTLVFVLLGCTVFAWGNFLYTIYKYYEAISLNQTFTGCSGIAANNPLVTPCFVGSAIFLVTLVVGAILDHKIADK